MDGARFLDTLADAKGSTVTDKICKSGAASRPAVMVIKFNDGSSVSFPRAAAQALKDDEQAAAFISKLLG